MDNFKISFSKEELQVVLNALVKEPYAQVFKILNSIQTQFQDQVKIEVPTKEVKKD